MDEKILITGDTAKFNAIVLPGTVQDRITVFRNDNGDEYETAGVSWVRTRSGGAWLSLNQTIGAGDRLPLSTVESYKSVKEDWNYTSVSLAIASTTIHDGPTILGNIWVDTVMSAHECPIKDGAVTVCRVPASSAVGFSITHQKGTRCPTSLIVDPPDGVATGIIVVQWRKL